MQESVCYYALLLQTTATTTVDTNRGSRCSPAQTAININIRQSTIMARGGEVGIAYRSEFHRGVFRY